MVRGGEIAKETAAVVDCLVNACECSSGLDRATEMIVGTIGQFNGKDVMSYLEAYMAEFIMRDIPQDKRLS